ncbi:uncharacterized protein LOC127262356 [Andrographis paniculata]|uniref:uncharacterized protein LOC127262356 n=1 Tax=Andrographis paniculata TaxID=175694 RepID=UPI0021E891CB|nr:uncharacterized protein LOC127262356 [Andrographis paniculata]
MDSRMRSNALGAAFSFVFIGVLISAQTQEFDVPAYPKAVSELKVNVVKSLGLKSDDLEVFGFDVRDAVVGETVTYEFHVQIDDGLVFPLKVLKDAFSWKYVDLPIFRMEKTESSGYQTIQRLGDDSEMAVLAQFQLAGPTELWIQDAKDMKISFPDDVDAGELKKVILADNGVVVTIKDALSVSLRHPVELPLPMTPKHSGFASSILYLGKHLQENCSSHGGPLLSLSIVSPSSLASTGNVEVKQLAPGLVELSSKFWPAVSITGSNSTLLAFEKLLFSVLGSKANEFGSFKLLKADVSAHTMVKMNFGIRRKVRVWDPEWKIHEWRTKPEYIRRYFEIFTTVDGDMLVPLAVGEVDPVKYKDPFVKNEVLDEIDSEYLLQRKFKETATSFTL